MKTLPHKSTFLALVVSGLLSGCCITLPKLSNEPAPCNPRPTYDMAYGCPVCYGESGCCEKECPKTRPPKQVLYQYPLHHYGWTDYQRRYGSAAPAFGPALVLRIPPHLRADTVEGF